MHPQKSGQSAFKNPRHFKSKNLPWAAGGSILGPRTKDFAARGPRTKDFASRGPRNLRSGGTLPQISGTLYVGRRCILNDEKNNKYILYVTQ